MELSRKHCILFLAALAVAVCFLFVKPDMNAYAADTFKKIPTTGKILKCGGKYFAYTADAVLEYSDSRAAIGTADNAGHLVQVGWGDVYTDGSVMYYVRYNESNSRYYLIRFTISSGKEKKIRKLPQIKGDHDESWSISFLRGNNIYLERGSFDKWRLWIYVYNIETGKLKKAATNASIAYVSGNYFISQDEKRTDVAPYRISIYKFTANGVKKIKTAGKYCSIIGVSGGTFYYASYPYNSMRKCTLYSISANGKTKKKLKTFKSSGEDGSVIAYSENTKYCTITVMSGGKTTTYRYTYKTGKTKKVKVRQDT